VYIVYVGSVAGFFIMASVPGASSPYSSDTNLRSGSDDGQHTPLVAGDSALTVAADSSVVSASKKNSVKSPSPSIKSRSTSSAQWVANSSSSANFNSNSNGNSNSNSNSNSPAMMLIDRIESEDVEEVQGTTSGGNGDFRLLKLVLKSLWDYITAPVSHVVTSLIPPLIVVSHDPDTKKPVVSIRSAVCSLSACIVAISVSAYAIIFFTKLLVAQIGVGTTTVGATLVSLGAEIPDTISSISLARNGHHDGAMAGAIGSQVINITLGVGLPALISCWLYGGSLLIEPAQIKR
jgi:Ca2+/Na+ antiporter